MSNNGGCEGRQCFCGARFNCTVYKKILNEVIKTGGCEGRGCDNCIKRFSCQVHMDIVHPSEWSAKDIETYITLWYRDNFRGPTALMPDVCLSG